MENKIKFLYIYLLLLILLLVKADISIIKIDFDNVEIFKDFNTEKYMYINIKSQKDLPNYIKLIAKDKYQRNKLYPNIVLSYYQEDSTFTNRKQLSQNSSDTTIMWLNKEQIKNGFYLSLECSAMPCYSYFYIIPENSIKLYLGQIYQYYITEQNKEMKFNIQGNITKKEKKIISIYAKG